MTVLVAYDGSEQSAFALEMAVEAFPEQTLRLVHVIEPFADHTEAGGYSATRYEQEFERAESMLQEVIDSLPADRSAEQVVRYGRPIHELLAVAEDEDIDHIVMGSHGRDGAKRLLLGSVAETVVRRASAPVTVVRQRPAGSESPTRVLVPFDGSEPAKAALEYAVDRYSDAEITAVYAVYPPRDVTDTEENAPGALESWADHLDEHTEAVIHAAEDHVDDGIRTDTVGGDPAPAIVRYAEEHDVDHIVMGSHGRDGIQRLIMGSVAETVVRRAPTTVTVVRGPAG
ncbi:MAG: nucleotide-binding universal stress UspA family protein [Natronomonas sp.]|jgi:nucleotide-binding universal stress UspA family protein